MNGVAGARILMTADAVGGVWRFALDAAEGLQRRDARVRLAGLGPAPSAARLAEAAAAGVEVTWVDPRLDWTVPDAAAAAALGAALAEEVDRARPDLVHLNAPALGPFLPADTPSLVTAHSCLATWWAAVEGGAPPARLAWHAELTGAGLRGAAAATAPTEAFAGALRRAYGPLPRLRVAPNAARPVTPAAKGSFVLTAGRWWDKAKGLPTLDSAAEGLAWPVLAAGPLHGPDGQAAEPAHLRPLGDIPHAVLMERVARAPIFVSTALYEPFGLAALEAASAGASLMLSDIPTFRELWDGCALFAAPRDARGFAVGLRRLIDEPALRARLGGAARRRARAFGLDAQAEALAAAAGAAMARDRLLVGVR
jgi:glycosyltransferase involved in cell wall biosynthesis